MEINTIKKEKHDVNVLIPKSLNKNSQTILANISRISLFNDFGIKAFCSWKKREFKVLASNFQDLVVFVVLKCILG